MLLRISSQSWSCWFWSSSRWAPHGYCQWTYRWTQTVQEGWLLQTLAAVHLMEDTEHACSALILTHSPSSGVVGAYCPPISVDTQPGDTCSGTQPVYIIINHYTPHTSCCIHLHIWTECLWYSCAHLQEVYWELFCLVQKQHNLHHNSDVSIASVKIAHCLRDLFADQASPCPLDDLPDSPFQKHVINECLLYQGQTHTSRTDPWVVTGCLLSDVLKWKLAASQDSVFQANFHSQFPVKPPCDYKIQHQTAAIAVSLIPKLPAQSGYEAAVKLPCMRLEKW